MSTIQKLAISSHNKGKIRELHDLLAPLGIELVTAASLNLSDVEETGSTFAENAILKAELACKATGLPALADDSGLCVDALDGRPGIYSARYPGGYEKILEEMENVPFGERSAHFECVLALALPGRKTQLFDGRMDGFILTEPRGKYGFGYDPIFLAKGENISNAEMLPKTKNTISHRGRALRKLLVYLKSDKNT